MTDDKRPGLRQRFIAQDTARYHQARNQQPSFQATAVYTPPVAQSQPSSGVSFKQKWDGAVAAAKAKGLPNAKAVMEANARYPGLRESMVAEVNANRR